MAPRVVSTRSEKDRRTSLGDRGTVVCGDGSVRRRTAWADAAGAAPTTRPHANTTTATRRRVADMASLSFGPVLYGTSAGGALAADGDQTAFVIGSGAEQTPGIARRTRRFVVRR